MTKRILFSIVLVLLFGVAVRAQDSYTERAKSYIQKYGALAIQEQQRSGVPACITLGQGILETEAGASELMTKANNHFGIKCKSDYQGARFLHTDDAPMECFKMYTCAEESYKDHSDYLKRNQRYAQLFTLKTTDYKSWATCLKKCGYATNPQYAQNLIKIIENFNLQEYTFSGLDSTMLVSRKIAPVMTDEPETDDSLPEEKPTAIASIADSARSFIAGRQDNTPVTASPPDGSKIVTVNGMKAFYANKGEMLLTYAVKYKVRYPHLLEMNDLPDAPLAFNTCVYLEKKQTLGAHATHVVKAGESLLLISQLEGVQMKKLLSMNMLNPNEEPVPGATLYLQSATATKPEVMVGATIAHKTSAILSDQDIAKQDGDYIATTKVKTQETVVIKPVPVVKDTIAAVQIKKPVAEVIPPQPKPYVDTAKPQKAAAVIPAPAHVIVVKNEEAPKPKPIPIQAKIPEKVTQTSETASAASEEEFAKLKADLDKVVYADDSKLIAKQGTTTVTVLPPSSVKPATVAAAPVSDGAAQYTVKKGDTAFSIAKRNNISVDDLFKWNDITASGIKVGKTLRVK